MGNRTLTLFDLISGPLDPIEANRIVNEIEQDLSEIFYTKQPHPEDPEKVVKITISVKLEEL